MRPVVLVVVMAGCSSGEVNWAEALSDCRYTSESVYEDLEPSQSHGAYDENGDHVLDEVLDPTTGEPGLVWEATYGKPHQVATKREWSAYEEPAERLDTFTWAEDRVIRWEVDADGDGVTDSITDTSYDETGHVITTTTDTDADGVPETVVTDAWIWTETDEGWTAELVKEGADGSVTTQTYRLDARERVLHSLYVAESADDEFRSEKAVEGYGDLEWAAHEVYTEGYASGGSGMSTALDQVFDEDGRWVAQSSHGDFLRDGEVVSTFSASATRVWSCP